ncbi:MAG: hypothetical protein JO239_14595, partial [Paraburkholderia sp.]|nr:hypothetical protein [Paraburkholderia sp.]
MLFPLRCKTPASATKLASFAISFAAALCLAGPLAQTAYAVDTQAASAPVQDSGQELQNPSPSAKPARSLAQNAATKNAQPATPADLYGRLYHDVQLARVFPDSKTFADMVP